eukprot:CAMPEP_0197649020 /NCGR_PEP_ID=MMETSP1338-20131121/28103_1 /TAXON_ID=43686 ORGANISM="Pelagodinium beii, Strain RCC1491" /NCGR_SAMPLE_ID=MMETSP1338 /ASSEMBLY_ACC=CAM_ASM_000754 /LENGTH=82 /DNA_ID=CAMNT_0043223115 /DNA_START=221 /DNA_END=466 /DNA_ORIENTATION=-
MAIFLDSKTSFIFGKGAGEARLRSAQTRSLLLMMLRGKSPCLWAESASGRPQGFGLGASSEALSGALVQRLWPVAAAQACRE